MIERVREILKSQTAARAVLTGVLLTGAACAPTQTSGEQLKCPTTATEVSRLVGGDPRNWAPLEGYNGAWDFKSTEPQILNGARIGRIDVPGYGSIPYRLRLSTGKAWFICIDRLDKEVKPLEDSALTPTSAPSE